MKVPITENTNAPRIMAIIEILMFENDWWTSRAPGTRMAAVVRYMLTEASILESVWRHSSPRWPYSARRKSTEFVFEP